MAKNYRYEVDENNAVKIFDIDNPNENGAPFLFQPDYPNYDPFKNREDAIKWAEDKMAEMLDDNAPLAPLGYGHPKISKPTYNKFTDDQFLIN